MNLKTLGICLCVGFAVFYLNPYWISEHGNYPRRVDWIQSTMAAIGLAFLLFLILITMIWAASKVGWLWTIGAPFSLFLVLVIAVFLYNVLGFNPITSPLYGYK